SSFLLHLPSFPTRRSSDLRVHLRLHHHRRPVLLRDRLGIRRGRGDFAGRNRHTVATKDFLRLVLVNIHTCSVLVASSNSLEKYRSEEHTSELQSRENLVCR